jgi:spore coat polysaccharide biosynthesis protein SpsF (cytidylyltransferase family)
VIGEVLTRCQRITGVDEVVCAIPEGEGELRFEAAKYAAVYEGPEHDVLSRYCGAAVKHEAEIIMRITADCPLLSPELCAEVLNGLKQSDADYASNILPRTFPKGFDCEVFTLQMLWHADMHSEDHEREHVTPWMQRDRFIRRVNIASPWPLDGRLTLDTWDDYKTICAAFNHDAPEHLRAA